MRIVCLSDTHGYQNNFKVPDGDLLLHAGDFCYTGSELEVKKFAKWICRLPHPHKVVVAGNHDWFFQKQPELARLYLEPEVIYLQDSGCEVEGLKIWGSPWQPWFLLPPGFRYIVDPFLNNSPHFGAFFGLDEARTYLHIAYK